jgi:NitT/TauT family transport system substrate-binding protein
MRRIFSLIVLCLSFTATTPGTLFAADKVVFAQASEASFTQLPILVARGLKLFESRNIEPDFVILKSSATLVAALTSGDAQVSFTTAASAIKARAKKQDIRIIAAVMNEINSGIVIQGAIASKLGLTSDTPLVDRIKALKGLRLAVSTGSANEFVLRQLIESAGHVPDRDMILTPIGADAMVSAFANKRIDGFIMAPPLTTTVIHKNGAYSVVDFAKGEYAPLQGMLYGVLVATDRWLESNTDVAARVVRTIWDAEQIIAKEPDKARDAVAPYFAKSDPDVFHSAFEASRAAIHETPRIDAAGITKNLDFIRSSEKENIELSPADIFTNKFVDAAEKIK